MNKRNFIIGIILILTFFWIFIFAPFTPQLFSEAQRIDRMNKCFLDRQIPCRWITDLGEGYGTPLFNYLPPLPYYFGGILPPLVRSLSLSVKIMITLSFLGAFFSMHYYAKSFSKKSFYIATGFSVTSILFNYYTKGGMGQLWAFALFPLIVLILTMLSKKVTVFNMFSLAIFLSLLLTSYYLSFAILFIIFALVIFFCQKIWNKQFLFPNQKKKFINYSMAALVIALFLSSFYLLPALLEKNLVNDQKKIKDFSDPLPIYATEAPIKPASHRFEILTGESHVFDFKQSSNSFSFKTNTKTHTIIRLSQFYFPNWKIYVDGKETEVEYKNNSLGLMTIILGEGDHTIEAKLYDTPIRTLANFLTPITLTFVLIVFLYQHKDIKRWIAYYRKGIGN